MVEYVYHVDEDDNVIGKVARKEMRDRSLHHRCTAIFVFNSKGDILIHKRTLTKDLYPGYYDMTIGGTVQFGESYEEGAKREIKEEIGAENCMLKQIFMHKYIGERNNTFIQVYRTTYDGKLKFQKEEVEFGRFITLDELKKLMEKEKFCPDAVEIFERYMDDKNGND